MASTSVAKTESSGSNPDVSANLIKDYTMHLLVSEAQVRKNRLGIQTMWKKIPKAWVDLGVYLEVLYDDGLVEAPEIRKKKETALVLACDGKDGPHNPCGAVGCFAGWNWTYHPYQQWCTRQKLVINSVVNLSIWLGLDWVNHDFFDMAHMEDLSPRAEVNHRIKLLLRMPIETTPQKARTIKEEAYATH